MDKKTGYAPVNGLRMYYEITGAGAPLIFIPPALGWAGCNAFPELTRSWRVVQVDLQGHGRTADIERPLSFAQHAEDVVALMRHLDIERAHLFGYSYGGLIAMMIALKYPALVDRIATYGSLFGPPQEAIRPEMLASPFDPSPHARSHQFQREAYERMAPDPSRWAIIWDKVVNIKVDGLTRDQIASVKHRVLVALGDNDFIRLEHAFYAFSAIPNAELAVVPDAGHFVLYSQPEKVEPIVAQFLAAPDHRAPFGTIATGYQPGETR